MLAVEAGAVSADHLVNIDEKDIAALAGSEVTCVLLPTSDFYLNMKYPPARSLIEKGARIALATDFNPGTSPTLDLNWVGLLSRREMKMTLAEVIVAYTLGGAFALNLQDEIGSIEVGKRADFVVLEDPWQDLFYRVGVRQVKDLYRNGKILKIS